MDEISPHRQPALPHRIALVTDSTCDLSHEARLRYAPVVVPLHISVGEVTYRDRVDLDSASFYQMFRAAGQSAHSSQPSPGEFAQVYADLLQSHEAVLSVHLSGRLSGTVESAALAAQMTDSSRVRVVDSRQVSAGLGLVVQAAGEAILAKGPLDAVVQAAESAARDTRVYGTTPSLEAAVKGGRVNAHAARIAGRLELMPIIVFDEDGGAHVGGGRIGYRRALRAVAGRVARFASGADVHVAVVHAGNPADAEYVRGCLRLLLGDMNTPVLEAGAVITTHVGLGAVAVGVQRRRASP